MMMVEGTQVVNQKQAKTSFASLCLPAGSYIRLEHNKTLLVTTPDPSHDAVLIIHDKSKEIRSIYHIDKMTEDKQLLQQIRKDFPDSKQLTAISNARHYCMQNMLYHPEYDMVVSEQAALSAMNYMTIARCLDNLKVYYVISRTPLQTCPNQAPINSAPNNFSNPEYCRYLLIRLYRQCCGMPHPPLINMAENRIDFTEQQIDNLVKWSWPFRQYALDATKVQNNPDFASKKFFISVYDKAMSYASLIVSSLCQQKSISPTDRHHIKWRITKYLLSVNFAEKLLSLSANEEKNMSVIVTMLTDHFNQAIRLRLSMRQQYLIALGLKNIKHKHRNYYLDKNKLNDTNFISDIELLFNNSENSHQLS